jgi:hypothetical protein
MEEAMKRLHVLFSLTSLVVLLVTIERFSITTRILLQPYNFLRLHEVVQITILILATVLIPFFLLKEVSHDFATLRIKRGLWLGVVFLTGVYFYATGNGLHELASFLLNQYCDSKHIQTAVCGSFFVNDYYVGNILYFVGAAGMNLPLVLLEVLKPRFLMTRKDLLYMVPNILLYAFTIVAYAGFDLVVVGLVYALITTIVIDGVLLFKRRQAVQLPVTVYLSLTYTLGTIVAIIVRWL